MRLKDKVALITGAASGIGACTAQLFAREGARVAIGDVLETEGKAVCEAIRAAGGEAMFVRLDVGAEQDWSAAASAVSAHYGRIDILVNNAGISGAVPDRMDLAYYDKLMQVNARGTFLGVRAVVPLMQKTGGGAIVNLSSISGIVGQEFVHMGYNAAKGAIRTLTKSAAVQYGKHGIRVNSVHPGLLPPMRSSKTSADPALREQVIKTIPLGRAGKVEDAAYAVLFLASDEASFISGAELTVDGGFLAA